MSGARRELSKEIRMTKHDHPAPDESPSGSFWSSRAGMALVAFLAVAAVLLLYEHRIHVFTGSGLLFILLGFCLVVHLFMHGSHGGHGSGGGGLPPGRGGGDER
jgi:hypothetical protein